MKDQTAKADAGKARISLVPTAIIYAIAKVREYGCNRYPEGGKDNWKRVEAERYRDALGRHYLAYIDEPYGVDRESGLPHLWHLATNCAFLCELDGIQMANVDAEKRPESNVCESCRYENVDMWHEPCCTCIMLPPSRDFWAKKLAHDGCEGCIYTDRAKNEYPCSNCCYGYTDKYVRKENK